MTRLALAILLTALFLTAAAPGTSAQSGTAVLSGTILAEDGKPVRRATVRLTGSDASGARIAVTDDGGRFTYAQLPAASFALSATKAGYVTAFYGSTRPGRGPAVPLALAASQRLVVSMTMLRGAAIAGTITDPFGRPAPQVTVQANLAGMPAPLRATQGAPNYATTDDLGMFRIYGLAPGDYVVSALPRVASAGPLLTTDAEVQWARQQLSPSVRPAASAGAVAAPAPGRAVVWSPVYFPGTTDVGNASKIRMNAGEERADVAFALEFVPTATLAGLVTEPSGRAASNAVVMLTPKSAGSAPAFQAMLDAGIVGIPHLTVTSGEFAVHGVTPGRYTLIARADEDASTPASAGAGTLDTLWGLTDVIVDGRDLSGLTVALQPGRTVTGRIVFDGRSLARPVDPGAVRMSLTSTLYGLTIVGTPSVTMKPDWTFASTSVPAGPYVVKVTPPSAPRESAHWSVASVTADGRDVTDVPLEIGGLEPRDLVVTLTDRETEISGTLLDAANRPTSAFAIVVFTTNRAFWTPGSRRVQSVQPATDGTFRLTGLPPGEYAMVGVGELDASALADPGYLEQLQAVAPYRITLADGEKKRQDLRLAGSSE